MRKLEVEQDGEDDGRLSEEREDAHVATTRGAEQGVGQLPADPRGDRGSVRSTDRRSLPPPPLPFRIRGPEVGRCFYRIHCDLGGGPKSTYLNGRSGSALGQIMSSESPWYSSPPFIT